MTNIIPNSLEFALLTADQQREVLEARATKRITLHRPSCICPECRKPPPWYYEPDAAKALERWHDNSSKEQLR